MTIFCRPDPGDPGLTLIELDDNPIGLKVLESIVPASARTDTGDHRHVIDTRYLQRLTVAWETEGLHVLNLSRRGGHRRRSSPPPLDFGDEVTDWVAVMHRSLTPPLRKKAYRALSKVLHPDVGGDPVWMQRLNDVFGGEGKP